MQFALLGIKKDRDVSSKGHVKPICRMSGNHMIIYHILILRRKGYFTYRWLNLNSMSALYFTVLFRELMLRQSNDLRNKLQDRYLKLVYKDQNCEFVGWTIWIFNSSNESARVKDGNAWRSKWNFPTCIT